MFYKKGALKYFAKSKGKTPVAEPFFLDAYNFIKKLWHRYFSVNFAKFLRTPVFIGHFQCLPL